MLSKEHFEMLTLGSAITEPVINARGYRTIDNANELMEFGFKSYQCRAGLLIPIHTTDGGNGLYRIRPDNPRVVEDKEKKLADGSYKQKVFKYEQPAHTGLRLDCNPIARPLLPCIDRNIFFTEGEKKGDSLVSKGQCAISLPGVTGYKARNGIGGVTVSADFDHIALNGRICYIVLDSDACKNPDVSRAEAMLAEHLRRKKADVRIIRLPDDGKKQGVDDFFAAGHDLDDLFDLVVDGVEVLSKSYHHVQAAGLVGIQANARHLRDVSNQAMEELVKANAVPYLFVRSGQLVRLGMDEHQTPRIELVDEGELRHRLARVANFFTARATRDGQEFAPTDPPMVVVRDIIAAGRWPFLPITGIIECPSIRPDGTVISQTGYDAETCLFYIPQAGLEIEQIPDNPTLGDIAKAKKTLVEPIQEFPFADVASLANTLAAMITPIMRPAIRGRVPMAIFDAPNMGTGKSLLSSVISSIATGRPQAVITAPRDDDEWRKRITASLLSGASVITIDNLTGKLFSGDLAAVITAPEWCDRMLGSNSMVTLPSNATWQATGNNVQLAGDMARRCYWVRLDAKLSRPWQRADFRIDNLQEWVLRNRGRLISAALTLARAWWVAGCKRADLPKVGGFEDWTRIVGGILTHAGVEGFLGNLVEMYESADTEGPQWETFLKALHDTFKNEPVTVAQICDKLASDKELQETVPDQLGIQVDNSGSIRPDFKTKLGVNLKRRRGTRFGDSQARIEEGGTSNSKAKKWVIKVEEGEEGEEGDSNSTALGTIVQQINIQKSFGGETPSSPSSPSSQNDLFYGEI